MAWVSLSKQKPTIFLPYGSTGLILTQVEIPGDDDLLFAWNLSENKIVSCIGERGWFRSQRPARARRGLKQINDACSRAEIKLAVRRAIP